MNVTVKLEDKLCKAARHKAVDAGQSLSAWLASLIAKEIQSDSVDGSMTLAEALGDEELADFEWDLTRNKQPVRPAEFE